MRYALILSLVLALGNLAYSQNYIKTDKSSSKKTFEKYASSNALKTVVEETDTTLTFLVRDPKVQNLDIILHFDQNRKCDSEIHSLSCDSCYQKYLNNILSNKNYKWTKVSAGTYFSNSRYRLILTAPSDKPFSFMIQRSKLTRREYDKIKDKN